MRARLLSVDRGNGDWGLGTGDWRMGTREWTAVGLPLGLEGSSACGARVLSFVCCAPNDGFGPQSGLVQRGVLYAAAWGSENLYNRPAGEEMQSPFGGWRHHLARWEACHLILSRLRLLANQVPLPPGGKHVTGFAGRLQLPYESSSFATPAVRWGGKRKAP